MYRAAVLFMMAELELEQLNAAAARGVYGSGKGKKW